MSTVLDPGFRISLIMTLYYKMRQILLQNVTAILLQNATEVYYKMRRLLQIATVHFIFDFEIPRR